MNLCNNDGNSPLWEACCNGLERIVKILMVNGVDVNLCNKDGDSLLLATCSNGHERTALLLLVNGAKKIYVIRKEKVLCTQLVIMDMKALHNFY